MPQDCVGAAGPGMPGKEDSRPAVDAPRGDGEAQRTGDTQAQNEGGVRPKRRQVFRACPSCRIARISCTESRPCPRCVRLKREPSCLADDPLQRRAKRKSKTAPHSAQEVALCQVDRPVTFRAASIQDQPGSPKPLYPTTWYRLPPLLPSTQTPSCSPLRSVPRPPPALS